MNLSHIPRVTFVVPVFNEPRSMIEASLISIKEQTFVNFECIIIDESNDIEAVITCSKFCENDCRFRYIHPDNRLGLAQSLNLGFSMARGEFIARFDADDICSKNRLEKQVAFLDAHPDIGVVGSWIQVIDMSGANLYIRRYVTDHNKIERAFAYKTSIAHPSVVFRRSSLQYQTEVYRSDFNYCEDLELWLRLLSKGIRFANIPECLVYYRQGRTDRPNKHWEFNIKARKLHLVPPYKIFKHITIFLLGIWAYIPKNLGRFIYNIVVYH